MCGIFGLAVKPELGLGSGQIQELVNLLFSLSETRGKEAAGLAMRKDNQITVYKKAMSATGMMELQEYHALFNTIASSRVILRSSPGSCGEGGSCGETAYSGGAPTALIGHARLVTNGRQTLPANNQPVVKNGLVGVHNGIITNDEAIWKKFPELNRQCEVDTEALLALMDMFYRETGSYVTSVQKSFEQLEGMASLALFTENSNKLLMATNNGSLYTVHGANAFVFASEEFILNEFLGYELTPILRLNGKATQLRAGEGLTLDVETMAVETFSLAGEFGIQDNGASFAKPLLIVDLSEREDPAKAQLRRCTKCILPETMPFIEFDAKGECSYCKAYSYPPLKGVEALEKILAPHRRADGRPDCVFAFSGGRDSSYGLHLVKKELGMNPVAFTYDWGMVTDLSRRNQARLCGKLGVEHILISADIKMKREYIRKNVLAWLKKPELGMIPLFMAGDKHFYHYAYQVMEQTGASVIIFSENMRYERAQFKEGFSGVNQATPRPYGISSINKFLLLSYYLKQYALNPAYINASLLDTVSAFYYSYMIKHDYVYTFDYLKWEEQQVNSTLIDDYKWELSPDTTSTWRIGDGTVPFYNYIYYTVAGFTEHDTFRSHQVRDGVISRDEALRLVKEENKPRWETMAWYAHTVGFDLDEAIRVINSMPKLYNR
ncbi:MAG: hypothetical protein OEZ32_07550 [Nitrospinota bacterium]|nr:hypothetical protein [Nitrospinota bacterium]